MGIDVEYVDMPALKYAMPAYYVLATSEASTNLARYVGMRYGHQDGDLSLKFDDYFTYFRSKYFGDEAKRRILLGTYTRMAGFRDRYYAKALKVRMYVIDAYKQILKDHDAVLAPDHAFVAPRIDYISKMTPSNHTAIICTVRQPAVPPTFRPLRIQRRRCDRSVRSGPLERGQASPWPTNGTKRSMSEKRR